MDSDDGNLYIYIDDGTNKLWLQPTVEGAQGPQGPQGPSGSQGQQGPSGSSDISGSEYYAAVYISPDQLRTGSIYDSGSFTAIGATAPVDPTNPDRLFIDAGDTESYNLLSGHGTVNNYLQLNIQNFSPGETGSSDIVATADNGDETGYFIDMGINGSGYASPSGIGNANDAYLYSTGQDLLIGNATPNHRVIIFNGEGPALDNARLYITAQGTVGVNASDTNLSNPEALLVEPLISGSAGNDFSNLIIGRGTVNENYMQLNIQNLGSGSAASSDIVATNDIGDETSYYIDMGVNSSGYNTPNAVGTASDAYLYSTAEHLHIGNASAGMPVMFFAGGLDAEANKKLELWPDNQHTMSGSLNITGSLRVLEGITGSLFGTASWAQNALTASFALNVSGTINNAINAETASYVNPLRQEVIVTGSLKLSGSVELVSNISWPTVGFNPTISTVASNTLNIQGGAVNISSINTGIRLAYSTANTYYFGGIHTSETAPTQPNTNPATNGGAYFQITSTRYGTLITRTDRVSSITGSAQGLLTYATASNVEGFWYYNSGSYQGWTRMLNDSGSQTISGSLTVTQGVTGSLFGTASWAQNALTASFALNVSGTIDNAISSSYAETASFAPAYLPLTGGTINGDVILNGTASIAFLNVTYESASVIYSSGSNQFGDATNDVQTLIGTVTVSGSQQVTGSLNAPNITGSLFGTASWANNATTASYFSGSVSNALTSSYSLVNLQQVTDNGNTTTNDVFFNKTEGSVSITNDGGDPILSVTANNGNYATITPSYIELYTNISSSNNNLKITIPYSYSNRSRTLKFPLPSSLDEKFIPLSVRLNNVEYISDDTGSIDLGTITNVPTASYVLNAVSSSFAISASQAQNAITASYVLASGVAGLNLTQIATASFTASVSPTQFTVTSGSITEFIVTGTGVAIGSVSTDTHTVTGSLNVSGSGAFTSDLTVSTALKTFPTSNNVFVGSTPIDSGFKLDVNGTTRLQNTLTISTGGANITGNVNVNGSVTASAALISGSGTQRLTVLGSGSLEPLFTVRGSQGELFTVSDSLSGSLFSVNDISGFPVIEVFSDSTTLMGSYTAPSLNTTVKTTTTNSGSFTIYSLPIGSYDGAFVEYTAKSGSNARAGQFMAIWSGSLVNYTDNSTTDFGNTAAFSLSGSVSASLLVITGNVTTGSGWVIKSIIRGI